MQDSVRDPAFGAADHVLVVGSAAAQFGVERVKRALARGVDEHPVHVREGVVAGGALALEAGGQGLARFQDLLDQQVAAAGGLPQPAQVSLRIGEAVRVVDPQPVDEPLPEPAHDLRVGFIEDLGDLDPDRRPAC